MGTNGLRGPNLRLHPVSAHAKGPRLLALVNEGTGALLLLLLLLLLVVVVVVVLTGPSRRVAAVASLALLLPSAQIGVAVIPVAVAGATESLVLPSFSKGLRVTDAGCRMCGRPPAGHSSGGGSSSSSSSTHQAKRQFLQQGKSGSLFPASEQRVVGKEKGKRSRGRGGPTRPIRAGPCSSP